MKQKVLVVIPELNESEEMIRQLDQAYKVELITSPHECPQSLSEYDLVLLDQSCTRFNAIDFIISVLTKKRLPILVLCDVQNSKYAPEAIKAGAFNFIVKAGPYHELLVFAIRDAISRYSELEELRSSVQQIKARNSSDEIVQPTGADEVPFSQQEDVIEEKRLNREIMQEIVDKLKNSDVNLPAYPDINIRFRELVMQGESINKISQVLEKDISISSKMISISNSAYFKGMAPVKTLEQAIGRIGISEARNYVELIANRSLYTNNNLKYKEFLERLWQHSLACAYAGKELCRVLYKGDPAEYFSMGLFHDIGKLLLIQIISELENKGAYSAEITEHEWKSIIRKYHGQFGASLMKRWKLSEEYAEVALCHEDPESAEKVTDALQLIHLANILAGSMGYSEMDDEPVSLEHSKVIAELGIDIHKLEEIKKEVTAAMQAGMVI